MLGRPHGRPRSPVAHGLSREGAQKEAPSRAHVARGWGRAGARPIAGDLAARARARPRDSFPHRVTFRSGREQSAREPCSHAGFEP